MKELLDIYYEYKEMYPEKSGELDTLVGECLSELEKGKKKETTINKYIKLMNLITKEDDECV